MKEMAKEEEYGPSELTMVLLLEDDAVPNIYIGMDTDPANAPLLPMHPVGTANNIENHIENTSNASS